MQSLNTPQLETWFKERQKKGGQSAKINETGLHLLWELHPEKPYPVSRKDGRFHRGVAVTVSSTDPEHPKEPWGQFMVEMLNTKEYQGFPINGIILLAQTRIEGRMSYLVQAKAEGGAIHQKNNVFLTTSIQASFSNAELNPGKIPLWEELAPDLEDVNKLSNVSLAPSIEDPGVFLGKHNLLVLRHL